MNNLDSILAINTLACPEPPVKREAPQKLEHGLNPGDVAARRERLQEHMLPDLADVVMSYLPRNTVAKELVF